MTVRVCSGFSPAGRVQYGERFLRAFDQYWPASTELQVYVEEPMPMPRDACRSLWDIPGATHFHNRHMEDPKIAGRVPQPCWKKKDVQRGGYSFKTDAYKFWKQILIPEAAAEGLVDGDILVWLDGDVETIRPVPEEFVPGLLPKDTEVVYLGRYHAHSEIGFWAVRINDRTRRFLHNIAEVYRTDQFLELREWHSAYVWDHVRFEAVLAERNLCSRGAHGHVWPMSPLARYMTHYKGDRKKVARG